MPFQRELAGVLKRKNEGLLFLQTKKKNAYICRKRN